MDILANWYYLKYVVKHKLFVVAAGVGIGCSWWRLIVHDLSKFLPSEWTPYVKYFYGPKVDNRFGYKADYSGPFNVAWLRHQHRNKHHWQYWILRQDNGPDIALQMPDKYVFEMVADWAGAGRAITGKWEVADWYGKNREKIILHEQTRIDVDYLIKTYFPKLTKKTEVNNG